MRAVVAVGVASAVLLVPVNASAARAFRVGVPDAGNMSAARVVLKVMPRSAVVRGLQLKNARRLPRSVGVAARLQRIGRTNRYIARVAAVRRGPARASRRAQAAQDDLPRQSLIFDVVGNGRSRVFDDVIGVNVLSEHEVPPLCFSASPDSQWTRFTPLVGLADESRQEVDALTQAVRDYLCARPVRRSIRTEFGTIEPAPIFDGVHRPFEGSPVEHVFRIHGNTDAGGLRIDPPAGGEFTACAGATCFIDSGRVLVVGPFPAGQDVDVNARATVAIPRTVLGAVYPGDSTGLFGGPPRNYRMSLGFRF
jgi:hypothetical protein